MWMFFFTDDVGSNYEGLEFGGECERHRPILAILHLNRVVCLIKKLADLCNQESYLFILVKWESTLICASCRIWHCLVYVQNVTFVCTYKIISSRSLFPILCNIKQKIVEMKDYEEPVFDFSKWHKVYLISCFHSKQVKLMEQNFMVCFFSRNQWLSWSHVAISDM